MASTFASAYDSRSGTIFQGPDGQVLAAALQAFDMRKLIEEGEVRRLTHEETFELIETRDLDLYRFSTAKEAFLEARIAQLTVGTPVEVVPAGEERRKIRVEEVGREYVLDRLPGEEKACRRRRYYFVGSDRCRYTVDHLYTLRVKERRRTETPRSERAPQANWW